MLRTHLYACSTPTRSAVAHKISMFLARSYSRPLTPEQVHLHVFRICFRSTPRSVGLSICETSRWAVPSSFSSARTLSRALVPSATRTCLVDDVLHDPVRGGSRRAHKIVVDGREVDHGLASQDEPRRAVVSDCGFNHVLTYSPIPDAAPDLDLCVPRERIQIPDHSTEACRAS
jgi:hypothetical protein